MILYSTPQIESDTEKIGGLIAIEGSIPGHLPQIEVRITI